MALRTKDERKSLADSAAETAIATMLTDDDGMDRVSALRLLVRSLMKKNVTNRYRPRSAVLA